MPGCQRCPRPPPPLPPSLAPAPRRTRGGVGNGVKPYSVVQHGAIVSERWVCWAGRLHADGVAAPAQRLQLKGAQVGALQPHAKVAKALQVGQHVLVGKAAGGERDAATVAADGLGGRGGGACQRAGHSAVPPSTVQRPARADP